MTSADVERQRYGSRQQHNGSDPAGPPRSLVAIGSDHYGRKNDCHDCSPGYAHEVLINATGVTRSSAGHFRGVTDLSRTGVDDIVDQATVKALGAKAKDVPFTATTDAKGRLTRLDLKIPAAGRAKAHTYSTVYDDYDTAQAPAAPAADEQQKAVPAVYDMLNG